MQILGVPKSADPIDAQAKQAVLVEFADVVRVGSHWGILDESEREHQQACQ